MTTSHLRKCIIIRKRLTVSKKLVWQVSVDRKKLKVYMPKKKKVNFSLAVSVLVIVVTSRLTFLFITRERFNVQCHIEIFQNILIFLHPYVLLPVEINLGDGWLQKL